MKNIVFISPRYLPAIGGVESHVANLSLELLHRGYKITILTVQHHESLPLKEKINGVWVERLPFEKINNKLATWWWMWARRGIFKNADVAHVHDVFWWYLPLRSWFFKNPIFTTFHGYEANGLPRRQAILQRKIAEKLSKKTLAIGDFIKKWYGQKPDMVSYGAAGGKLPSAAYTANHTVFIGRLEVDTGIEEYLEIVRQANLSLGLSIYGEGSLKQKLQQQVNRDHLPIDFCGLTSVPEQVIASGEIVFASQYLAILQAMQAKRLVVAIYQNPMKKDYLELHPVANAMVIASNAKEALGKLLILDRSQKSQMINSAYSWAKKQTWEQLADQYLSLWQDL